MHFYKSLHHGKTDACATLVVIAALEKAFKDMWNIAFFNAFSRVGNADADAFVLQTSFYFHLTRLGRKFDSVREEIVADELYLM